MCACKGAGGRGAAEGVGVKTLTTGSDTVVLRLPGHSQLKAELQRRNTAPTAGTALDSNNTSLESMQSGDEQVLTVKLAECAEYRLDVYESRDQDGGLQHVQTYCISRVQPQDGDEQHSQQQSLPTQQPAQELSPAEKLKLEKDKALGYYRFTCLFIYHHN